MHQGPQGCKLLTTRRPKGFHRQRIRARTAAAKAAAAAGGDGTPGLAASNPPAGPASAQPNDGAGVRSDGQADGEDGDVAAAEWRDLDVPQFHQVSCCRRLRPLSIAATHHG